MKTTTKKFSYNLAAYLLSCQIDEIFPGSLKQNGDKATIEFADPYDKTKNGGGFAEFERVEGEWWRVDR